MPYIVELEAGERIVLNVDFKAANNKPPFRFVVSNRALFLPRKKAFAVSDPTYFEKISFANVQAVSVKRIRPYFWWILAPLMVIAGLAMTCLMMVRIIKGEGDTVSGEPIAIAVAGIVLPFAVKGRLGLQIDLVRGRFHWKPPIVIDKASKTRINNVLADISEACRKVGLRVKE